MSKALKSRSGRVGNSRRRDCTNYNVVGIYINIEKCVGNLKKYSHRVLNDNQQSSDVNTQMQEEYSNAENWLKRTVQTTYRQKVSAKPRGCHRNTHGLWDTDCPSQLSEKTWFYSREERGPIILAWKNTRISPYERGGGEWWLRKLWNVKNRIGPILVGALGSVTNALEARLDELWGSV